MREVTIVQGDTLSGIAQRFGFGGDWNTLFEYNKKKNKMVDANVVHGGQKIYVPRTKKEYDKSIVNLNVLHEQVDRDMSTLLGEVDDAKAEADRVGDAVDFVSDIAMIGKGAVSASVKLGGKVLRYKLKKSALEATIKSAEYLAEVGDDSDELVVKNANQAVVDQSIMIMARKKFDGAKAGQKFRKGMTQAYAKKTAVVIAKAAGPVECAEGLGDLVGTVADIAISGIDAVKPSSVAKFWIWATTGEHPDDVAKRAKEQIRNQTQKSKERLRDTITRLEAERIEVYGQ